MSSPSKKQSKTVVDVETESVEDVVVTTINVPGQEPKTVVNRNYKRTKRVLSTTSVPIANGDQRSVDARSPISASTGQPLDDGGELIEEDESMEDGQPTIERVPVGRVRQTMEGSPTRAIIPVAGVIKKSPAAGSGGQLERGPNQEVGQEVIRGVPNRAIIPGDNSKGNSPKRSPSGDGSGRLGRLPNQKGEPKVIRGTPERAIIPGGSSKGMSPTRSPLGGGSGLLEPVPSRRVGPNLPNTAGSKSGPGIEPKGGKKKLERVPLRSLGPPGDERGSRPTSGSTATSPLSDDRAELERVPLKRIGPVHSGSIPQGPPGRGTGLGPKSPAAPNRGRRNGPPYTGVRNVGSVDRSTVPINTSNGNQFPSPPVAGTRSRPPGTAERAIIPLDGQPTIERVPVGHVGQIMEGSPTRAIVPVAGVIKKSPAAGSGGQLESLPNQEAGLEVIRGVPNRALIPDDSSKGNSLTSSPPGRGSGQLERVPVRRVGPRLPNTNGSKPGPGHEPKDDKNKLERVPLRSLGPPGDERGGRGGGGGQNGLPDTGDRKVRSVDRSTVPINTSNGNQIPSPPVAGTRSRSPGTAVRAIIPLDLRSPNHGPTGSMSQSPGNKNNSIDGPVAAIGVAMIPSDISLTQPPSSTLSSVYKDGQPPVFPQLQQPIKSSSVKLERVPLGSLGPPSRGREVPSGSPANTAGSKSGAGIGPNGGKNKLERVGPVGKVRSVDRSMIPIGGSDDEVGRVPIKRMGATLGGQDGLPLTGVGKVGSPGSVNRSIIPVNTSNKNQFPSSPDAGTRSRSPVTPVRAIIPLDVPTPGDGQVTSPGDGSTGPMSQLPASEFPSSRDAGTRSRSPFSPVRAIIPLEVSTPVGVQVTSPDGGRVTSPDDGSTGPMSQLPASEFPSSRDAGPKSRSPFSPVRAIIPLEVSTPVDGQVTSPDGGRVTSPDGGRVTSPDDGQRGSMSQSPGSTSVMSEGPLVPDDEAMSTSPRSELTESASPNSPVVMAEGPFVDGAPKVLSITPEGPLVADPVEPRSSSPTSSIEAEGPLVDEAPPGTGTDKQSTASASEYERVIDEGNEEYGQGSQKPMDTLRGEVKVRVDNEGSLRTIPMIVVSKDIRRHDYDHHTRKYENMTHQEAGNHPSYQERIPGRLPPGFSVRLETLSNDSSPKSRKPRNVFVDHKRDTSSFYSPRNVSTDIIEVANADGAISYKDRASGLTYQSRVEVGQEFFECINPPAPKKEVPISRFWEQSRHQDNQRPFWLHHRSQWTQWVHPAFYPRDCVQSNHEQRVSDFKVVCLQNRIVPFTEWNVTEKVSSSRRLIHVPDHVAIPHILVDGNNVLDDAINLFNNKLQGWELRRPFQVYFSDGTSLDEDGSRLVRKVSNELLKNKKYLQETSDGLELAKGCSKVSKSGSGSKMSDSESFLTFLGKLIGLIIYHRSYSTTCPKLNVSLSSQMIHAIRNGPEAGGRSGYDVIRDGLDTVLPVELLHLYSFEELRQIVSSTNPSSPASAAASSQPASRSSKSSSK